ncbi:MAG: hypothetical protein V1909_03890 [Candidatus Micrarchaeota archaeon]
MPRPPHDEPHVSVNCYIPLELKVQAQRAGLKLSVLLIDAIDDKLGDYSGRKEELSKRIEGTRKELEQVCKEEERRKRETETRLKAEEEREAKEKIRRENSEQRKKLRVELPDFDAKKNEIMRELNAEFKQNKKGKFDPLNNPDHEALVLTALQRRYGNAAQA